MENILITGGAGFIGSALSEKLLLDGNYNIVVADDLSTGSIDNIKQLTGSSNFKFIKCDVNNYQDISINMLWLGQIVAFTALLVFGSVLATFQYACWTELYLKLRSGKHLSKIIRVLGHYRQKYS